ncbi:Mba1p [Ascoidea rubescens DSM 1968]|uniref:MBA1-like protein n=1 Tax=Ascoidea rubescens DSM 1968 TaxID=1344418 RepID=A0A1D2VNU7_9ASCO|nr:MBA1-like protein [Ascoidea rubescens DSM 1968]ODV63225.1 MBA1-like protein [Ascoidea rubescens DSM 1968]
MRETLFRLNNLLDGLCVNRYRGFLNSTIAASRTPSHNFVLVQQKRYNSQKSKQRIGINQLGIMFDIYIPPSYSSYPNFFKHPSVFVRNLLRRYYLLGLNTLQIASARFQGGLKPKFLLWKNQAIESYIKVNQSFVGKDLTISSNYSTIWVQDALNKRIQSLPKNVYFDWKLIKFNKNPKLVTFMPFLIPGEPLDKVLIVYKFDTIQRVIKYNLKNNQMDKKDRNVNEYLGFIVDIDNNNVLLTGSLFESSIYDKVNLGQSKLPGTCMKVHGDIFRTSNKELELALVKK